MRHCVAVHGDGDGPGGQQLLFVGRVADDDVTNNRSRMRKETRNVEADRLSCLEGRSLVEDGEGRGHQPTNAAQWTPRVDVDRQLVQLGVVLDGRQGHW